MKSFTIYEEYYELITLLPEEEQQELSLAIMKYMFEGIEPTLNERQNKIFKNLKRPLDVSKKRSKVGSITKSNENQNEIKSKSNQNQNDNQKDNQNEIKSKSHQDVNVIVNNYDYDNKHNYVVNVDVISNLYDFIEQNFGRTLTPIEYEEISKWEDNELTRYAIKLAVLNGTYTIKYIKGILQNYKTKNITTVQQAQEDESNFKKRKDRSNLTAREKRDLEFEELLKKHESEKIK